MFLEFCILYFTLNLVCAHISETVSYRRYEWSNYTTSLFGGSTIYVGAKNKLLRFQMHGMFPIQAPIEFGPEGCDAALETCVNSITSINYFTPDPARENRELLICGSNVQRGEPACCRFDLNTLSRLSCFDANSEMKLINVSFSMYAKYEVSSKKFYYISKNETETLLNAYDPITRETFSTLSNIDTLDYIRSDAQIVGGFSDLLYTYIVFNEYLRENSASSELNKAMVTSSRGPRIARVCNDDQGHPDKGVRFYSFSKAYMKCATNFGQITFDTLVSFAFVKEDKGQVSGIITYNENKTRNEAAFCFFSLTDFGNTSYCLSGLGLRRDDLRSSEFKVACGVPTAVDTYTKKSYLYHISQSCPYRNPIHSNAMLTWSKSPVISMVATKVEHGIIFFALRKNGMLEVYTFRDTITDRLKMIEKACHTHTFILEDIGEQAHMNLHRADESNKITIIIGTNESLTMIESDAFCKVFQTENECKRSAYRPCAWVNDECNAVELSKSNFLEASRPQYLDCSATNNTLPHSKWSAWSLPFSCYTFGVSNTIKQCYTDFSFNSPRSDDCKVKENTYRCKCRTRVCLNKNGCDGYRWNQINSERFEECEVTCFFFTLLCFGLCLCGPGTDFGHDFRIRLSERKHKTSAASPTLSTASGISPSSVG
ncbi:hypothetical protein B4U79_16426 [Dinothrombium tinctorium]|uniref:Sema domain-containing protein n=1 Tax=Dinothrombium tinctorium TaxID=1965070 RepID=A0A3S3NYC3_9ACAR|nr:hypothetical protein B4U79_16426 [Dinothrombium tinctorium]